MNDPFGTDQYLGKSDGTKSTLHLLKPQPGLKYPNKRYIDSKAYTLRGFLLRRTLFSERGIIKGDLWGYNFFFLAMFIYKLQF